MANVNPGLEQIYSSFKLHPISLSFGKNSLAALGYAELVYPLSLNDDSISDRVELIRQGRYHISSDDTRKNTIINCVPVSQRLRYTEFHFVYNTADNLERDARNASRNIREVLGKILEQSELPPVKEVMYHAGKSGWRSLGSNITIEFIFESFENNIAEEMHNLFSTVAFRLGRNSQNGIYLLSYQPGLENGRTTPVIEWLSCKEVPISEVIEELFIKLQMC